MIWLYGSMQTKNKTKNNQSSFWFNMELFYILTNSDKIILFFKKFLLQCNKLVIVKYLRNPTAWEQ